MSVVNGDGIDLTREMLIRERAAVVSRIKAITQEALSFELETDGIPPSGHEGEQALIRMLDSRLNEIDEALARVDTGKYGVCADCSTEIPLRRLEALPFATLCISCQSVADKRGRRLLAR